MKKKTVKKKQSATKKTELIPNVKAIPVDASHTVKKRYKATKKSKVLAELPGLIITRMSDKAPLPPVIKDQIDTLNPEPDITAFARSVVDEEIQRQYETIAHEFHNLVWPKHVEHVIKKVKEFVNYFRTKRRESVLRLLEQYSITQLTHPSDMAPNGSTLYYLDFKWDTETWYVHDVLKDLPFTSGIWRERDTLDDIQEVAKYGPLLLSPSREESLLLAYTCLCWLHDFHLPFIGVGPCILPEGQFHGFDNGYEVGWITDVRRYYCDYGRNPLRSLSIFLDDVGKDLIEGINDAEPKAQTGEALPPEGAGQPVQSNSTVSEETVKAGVAGEDKKGLSGKVKMNQGEINTQTWQILTELQKNKEKINIRKVAKQIGCSISSINKTPAWRRYMEVKPRKTLKVVSLPENNVLKDTRDYGNLGEESNNETLDELIRSQQDDQNADNFNRKRRKQV